MQKFMENLLRLTKQNCLLYIDEYPTSADMVGFQKPVNIPQQPFSSIVTSYNESFIVANISVLNKLPCSTIFIDEIKILTDLVLS